MAKKKGASIGSADSVLRRAGREGPSRKQKTVSLLVNSRKSESIEKHTSPSRLPDKSKLEKAEKQMGSSLSRRSNRVKKLIEILDLPNIKSTQAKTANNSKLSSKDVNEDKKTEKQDSNVGGRKRKKSDAIHYNALFKPKRTRIESDVAKELKSQNSTRVQDTPVKDHKSDNQTFRTSSCRMENDLPNQHELDTCQKGEEAFKKINREQDQKRAGFESDYKVDKSFILAVYRNPSTRSEKLKILEREVAKKLGEKRASLENGYKVDKAFIHSLYRNPSIRYEKLKVLEKEFAKKLEEHERLWEIHLEELKATMPAAVGQEVAENESSLHGSEHDARVVHSENPEAAPDLPKNPIEAQSHDEPLCEGANGITSTGSHTSEKEMADAKVSGEQIGEVPVQQLDDDDMEVDVAEKFDSIHENSKGGTSNPDASLAAEFRNETGVNDMIHVNSGDMEMPAGNYNKENDEDGTVGIDTSHVVEDRQETVNDVELEVDSAEMGTPVGTCDKENAEDVDTFHDTPDVGDTHNKTSPNGVLPHVDFAEMAVPVDKVDAEDSIIRAVAFHANEDHNDSCGSSSGDPVCAPISQDKTPSVQPVSSPASKHKIQNKPLQLKTSPESGVQDEETNVGNLQPSGASELDQIILDDEPDFPSSTNPAVAEHPSNTVPPSRPLLEPACEERTLKVPESGENFEENFAAAETPHEEQQPCLATSVASAPPDNALHMFDNLTNRVNYQMPDQAHPLQAEVERLYTVKDNVTKFHQETKQRLNTECEKEIAKIVAQINLKYEAKHLEADAAYNSKKVELEADINRVIMNRILAEAFRSNFQGLTPFVHQVSQAELRQQLCSSSVSPSMRSFNGQSSGNQQPPLPQPQLRPPLQIVHQPAALFSTTPSRLPPPALLH